MFICLMIERLFVCRTPLDERLVKQFVRDAGQTNQTAALLEQLELKQMRNCLTNVT